MPSNRATAANTPRAHHADGHERQDQRKWIAAFTGEMPAFAAGRAIARRPLILLLDEATSVLDNGVQNIVANNLKAFCMTRIIVAHRLTTVRDADRIVVLDDGRIKDGVHIVS